jgi:hypothetical protein
MEQVCCYSIIEVDSKCRFVFRRWFSIRNGQLLYMKRHNGNSTNDSSQQPLPHSVMVPDLRLCTIRPVNDNDRRFVFEILSPNRLIDFFREMNFVY